MAADYGTILVSGVSGFIGSHVAKLLLESGYRVRGTVRSLQNEAKVNPIRSLVSDAKFPIELFEADLNSDEGWAKALEGCRALMHVASPFPNVAEQDLNPDEQKELIETAKGGTLRVLKAAKAANVDKVVLTSSVVSIFADLQAEAGKVYTEEDWADTDSPSSDPYSKSKVIAEKAAWEYIKELPDGNKMDLAVINPCLVVGPLLIEAQKGATSATFVSAILARDNPAHPRLGFNFCDVRDVAQAHLKALLNPNAWGHRHIIYSSSAWIRDISLILSKEFRQQGYNIPTIQVPNFVCWMASFLDKRMKYIVPRLGLSFDVDNKRMTEVLGIKPKDLDESIVDMGYSLVDLGIVKKAKKYKLAGKFAPEKSTKTEETQPENVEESQKNQEEESAKETNDEKQLAPQPENTAAAE